WTKGLVHQRDADAHTSGEGSKLLEALDLCERACREPHPSREGLRRVDVNTDVLPNERALQLGVVAVAKKWDRRAGKIERTTIVPGNDLHDVRVVEDVRRGKHGGGGDRMLAVGHDTEGAEQRLARDERLVAL